MGSPGCVTLVAADLARHDPRLCKDTIQNILQTSSLHLHLKQEIRAQFHENRFKYWKYVGFWRFDPDVGELPVASN
jgi:hypothetical protein